MKVEVERIKDNQLKLEEDIPASSWGMDNFDVKFVDNIHLTCNFVKAGKEISVDTEVITHRLITCSRCLEGVNQTQRQEFNLIYNLDDLEDYLEVDKDIREEVLLNFPMKVLCRLDCKGLCSGCGVNLNREKCKCQQSSKRKNQNAK